MLQASQLIKITDYLWEIPKTIRPDMKVPAYVYCKKEMLEAILDDRSLEQLINVATLPGIEKAAIVMPDAHEGYGFPIGGIAATHWPEGIISPGGIGYDINCGVRLLITPLPYDGIADKLETFSKKLYESVPSGTGKGGEIKLSMEEMDEVLRKGAQWAVENGMGNMTDLEMIESKGRLYNADPSVVSEQAKKRGHDQLGTIGAGNHFVEVDKVANIFDEKTAAVFGIQKNQVVILVHTGSRGLGHQVATDYLRLMMNVMPNYGFKPKDRELAGVPFNSKEGQDYFNAMSAAANFAWCNREVITYEIRQAWQMVFGRSGDEIKLLYDVAHNIAKIEEYLINGVTTKLIVHRKGATRAFGPGNNEVPEKYRSVGQPVLIPGSMGTASYILVGTNKSMEATFGSTCHGAGRRLSRTAAKKQVGGPQIKDELLKQGIYVQAGSYRGIAEEAPVAYKDIDMVVDTVHDAGIALKVAKLNPIAVIKG
ncbi:MAG: RtcB family protein [Bacteroidota bacterium]|nr:RtcB family protein [Bacteroidota bacterium]